MPGYSCVIERPTQPPRAARLTQWLVSGPPLTFLLLLVALPSMIMVLASFRYPGEFGGLAQV